MFLFYFIIIVSYEHFFSLLVRIFVLVLFPFFALLPTEFMALLLFPHMNDTVSSYFSSTFFSDHVQVSSLTQFRRVIHSRHKLGPKPLRNAQHHHIILNCRTVQMIQRYVLRHGQRGRIRQLWGFVQYNMP